MELISLEGVLSESPAFGTPLGCSMFKVRVSIKSKAKGKSGGARVITYLVDANDEIYLLTIYDKSEFETVDERTLRNIVKALVRD